MAEEKYYHIPRSVLIIAIVLSFGMWVPLMIIPPMEDLLAEKLSVSHALISLLYAGPILMLALVGIPGGFLADVIGIKKAAGIGAILIVIGTVLRGIATDYSSLLAFTFIYGIGLGLAFPNMPKLVSHCTSQERIRVTMGLLVAGILVAGGLGLAITMPVIYAATHSYHTVFLIWAIAPLVATILWWAFIKDPPCESAGVEVVSVDLSALRSILRKKSLAIVSALFFLHNIFFYTWAGSITLFMLTKGATTDTAGLIISVVLWLGVPSVIFLPRLQGKLASRKFFILGSSLVLAVAAVLVMHITLNTSWFLMAFVGIATSIRFTTLVALPAELVPRALSGTASGLVMSLGYLGAILGPFVAGYIIDVTGSFRIIFIMLIAASVITSLLSLAVTERPNISTST